MTIIWAKQLIILYQILFDLQGITFKEGRENKKF